VASEGTKRHCSACSVPGIQAKYMLGALFKPLFGQFQSMNSANFAFTEFSEVRPQK